jgi:5-methylcytosine-specific restriction endonuclease McrA
MSKRDEFSSKTRMAAYERSGGHCEEPGCGLPFSPSNPVEYDHEIEAYYGGTNDLDNCKAKCRSCHKVKTSERAAVIAKSRRLLKKQAGLTRTKKRIGNRGFTSWRNFAGEIVTKKG